MIGSLHERTWDQVCGQPCGMGHQSATERGRRLVDGGTRPCIVDRTCGGVKERVGPGAWVLRVGSGQGATAVCLLPTWMHTALQDYPQQPNSAHHLCLPTRGQRLQCPSRRILADGVPAMGLCPAAAVKDRGPARTSPPPPFPPSPSSKPRRSCLYGSQQLLLHQSAVLFHSIGPAHRCGPVNAGCLSVILPV